MVTLQKLIVVRKENVSYVKCAKVFLKQSGFCTVYVDGTKYKDYVSIDDFFNQESFIENDEEVDKMTVREVVFSKHYRKKFLN